MATDRRGFLIGLGAMLAASQIPVAITRVARAAPAFAIEGPIPMQMTYASLAVHLRELFGQVRDFAPWPEEYPAVVKALEEALWPARPAGMWIEFDATLADMVEGSFHIHEDPTWPGMVTVRSGV